MFVKIKIRLLPDGFRKRKVISPSPGLFDFEERE